MKNFKVFFPKKKKISEENLKKILIFLNEKKSNFFSLKPKKSIKFSLILRQNEEIETLFSLPAKNSWIFSKKIKKSDHFLVKNTKKELKNYKYILNLKPKKSVNQFKIHPNFLGSLADFLADYKGKNVAIKIDFLSNNFKENIKSFKKESFKMRTGAEGKILGIFGVIMSSSTEKHKMSDWEKEQFNLMQKNIKNCSNLCNIEVSALADDKQILKNLRHELDLLFTADHNFISYSISRKKLDLNDPKKINSGSKKLLIETKELAKLFTLNSRNYEGNNFLGAEIPTDEYIPRREELKIGVGMYQGQEENFYIPIDKKCLHSVIIGGTGCGKTEQMINQFISDVSGKEKAGGLFFDISSKEASRKILQRLPENRLKDVVFFDADDVNFNFDFFGKLKGETEEKQISRIIGMINELMAEFGSTINTERYIPPLVLLAVRNKMKIEDIHELVKPEFLAKNLHHLDVANKDKFQKFAMGKGLYEFESILRRLGNIAKNENLRKILNEENGIKFDLIDLMQKNKIVLLSIPHDEVTKPIIQAIIVSSLRNATFARKIGEKPFMVYLDEFSSFKNESESVNNLLDMARKYRVGLTIAIQHISQLKTSKGAVFGNVDSVFLLKNNPLDETFLKSLFKKDIDLEKWEALVRLGGKATTRIKMSALGKPVRSKKEVENIFSSFAISEEEKNEVGSEMQKEKEITKEEREIVEDNILDEL